MIIIPARLASTRFPRKILASIHGVPMVIASARIAQQIDEVCVACDDDSVLELCKKHKIKAVMTDKNHASGTDRCYEAACKLGLPQQEIILNMQADEPFLEQEVLRQLAITTKQASFMASCAKVLPAHLIHNPNIVKVVLDATHHALYFSRSSIPYNRDATHEASCNDDEMPRHQRILGHIGVYGYMMESLQAFCHLPKSPKESPLEHIEKLEQLRALYHGKSILIALVKSHSIGIDTPSDLEHALKHHP